jgi:hypothetical protein
MTRIVAIRPPMAGKPGQHLGASHVAKHWLNPGEHWDDLAEPLGVPEAVRPPALAAEVARCGENSPHTLKARKPSPGLCAAWPALEAGYEAYVAVVQAAFGGVGAIFSPGLSEGPAPVRHAVGLKRDATPRVGSRLAALLPGGIIAIGDAAAPSTPPDTPETSEEAFTMHLRTAYRPTLQVGARFGQGAMDAKSRDLRRGLSELRARRAFLLLTKRSTP